MDYNYVTWGMMGGNITLATPFMWLMYLLMTTALVLAIVALLKYIGRK
jgi:hypothetical protein